MYANKSILMLALAVMAGSGISRAAVIHEAAGKGDLAAVKAAVAANPAAANERDTQGATPLHYAAAGGQRTIVEYLITRKADVNARKPDGVTPLHVAAAMGRTAAARALLAHGAKRDAKDNAGRTAFSLAKAKGFHALAAVLQPRPAAGRSVRKTTGTTAVKTSTRAPKPSGRAARPASGDLTTRTLGVIRSLEAGNYTAVTRQFDATMSAAMSPAQLGQVWQGLKTQLGPYRRLGNARTKPLTANGVSMTTVIVPAEFGGTPLNVQVSYNPDGKIGGFYVLKPEASM